MTYRKKIQPYFHFDGSNSLTSGVGSGTGLDFVESYFPKAFQIIRIASGYFELSGYDLAREKFNSSVQLRILVRSKMGEGRKVQLTAIHIVEQIVADLGKCKKPLTEAVRDILEQMNDGRFFIRDAHEIEPFHCKYYICDKSFLWQGSANFTENGLCVNAEQASLITNSIEIQGFINWFDETSANGRDLLTQLKERLENWLKLAKPYDIYLKTLFLLFKDSVREPFLEGANSPAYFQRGVIEKALHQVEKFGGALIVAATGLGKTVIGSEIAFRLYSEGKIKQVILLAPFNVFKNWKEECDGRRVRCVEFFNVKVPFLEKSESSQHEINRLIKQLSFPADEMLIVVDEAHNYRNQLLAQNSEKRNSRVYDLLTPIVAKGARIVLLTATAYSTSPQNINSLLYLLPHKNDRFLKDFPWTIDSTAEFPNSPVASILGLPHVLKMARERGDVDENNRPFIRLEDDKRYLPKSVILHRENFRLPLQDELQIAFDAKGFDHSKKVPHTFCDADSTAYRKGVSDTVFNSSLKSWLSSFVSLRSSLEFNLTTEGDVKAERDYQRNLFDNSVAVKISEPIIVKNGRSFKGAMLLSLAERRQLLGDIYEKAKLLSAADDEKFLKLKEIVRKRCVSKKCKTIVFVNRFSTAVYLEEELIRAFGGKLKVGCTVKKSGKKLQLRSRKVRAEMLKNFSPKSHNSTSNKEYDLLICTDADGVGVNLQDANALVNYDQPLGADVLFQRVGRILRMTDDPERTVHIYTFVPSIVKESINGSAIHRKINELFERLKQRQDKSGGASILGTKILALLDREVKTISTVSEIEDLLRESEAVNDLDIGNSPFRHISLLEMKGVRERATAIPDYIFSARVYSESVSRLFVLFKYKENYFPVLYDIENKTVFEPNEFEILDMLECTEDEDTAPIFVGTIQNSDDEQRRSEIEAASARMGVIEAESLNAAKVWCADKRFPINEVTKICGLYFVPSDQNKPRRIFGDLRRKKV